MEIIKNLSKHLNRTESHIKSYLIQAPNKYKIYTIPKRSHGVRVIAHPAKELKEIQYAFLSILKFPVHEAAMAYVPQKSIKTNAHAHKNNQFLLKMDFENFFNSITPNIFWYHWNNAFPVIDAEERFWIERIIFWNNKDLKSNLTLSVGAPTSPTISNFCMYSFDEEVTKYCREKDITYTRYADDLTFTSNTKGILFNLPKHIDKTLKKLFFSAININNKKTKFSSKAHNRHITGITITNDEKLSIGRKRKR
ncbi:TPA: retron St85 family RNA-directed DNA polymerase, partial [Citrobacter freundii]|nr:retron St85 family RNA-directed DNA polymerase [Citrobacter freundii]